MLSPEMLKYENPRKQANWTNLDGHFLSAYISRSSRHSSLKLHTANCDTSNGMM